MTSGQDCISIHGPGDDGSFVIEFKAANGQFLAISVAASEADVLLHFQARMPRGIALPEYATQ
jgi:hypothetical protein